VRAGGVALAAVAALAVSACGGSQQDAHEPSGNFKVEIVKKTFPAKQKLAKRSQMVIAVKNVDSRALPDVAVTVDSFNRNSQQADLSDPSRPVFVVNHGGVSDSAKAPSGGETANQSTSALGHALAPGKVAKFVWNVTAVQAGSYNIHFTVSAGLFGKAVAVDAAGHRSPGGQFSGTISRAAPHSTVNFKNGKTVEGG
jgi:hypothetical protein